MPYAMPRLQPEKSAKPLIPSYSLYGQIDHAAELRFLHVETLSSRNKLNNWDIRPHRHHDLHQIVWVERGGGKVTLDDRLLNLDAPVLISIPPSVVHGFQWQPASEGLVLTVAESFKSELTTLVGDAAIAEPFQYPFVVNTHEERFDDMKLAAALRTIADEFVYERVGRITTIAGCLLIVFAEAARLKRVHSQNALAINVKGVDLYSRFRQLVEERFREHWPVSAYAAALAMTERSLRRLCMRFADQSPVRIINSRLVLEAKRNLLYTELSIAEVGYILGFEDPSYFTRFFINYAKEAPLEFRRRHLPGARHLAKPVVTMANS